MGPLGKQGPPEIPPIKRYPQETLSPSTELQYSIHFSTPHFTSFLHVGGNAQHLMPGFVLQARLHAYFSELAGSLCLMLYVFLTNPGSGDGSPIFPFQMLSSKIPCQSPLDGPLASFIS